MAGCTPPSRCTAGCRAAQWGTVESVALAWETEKSSDIGIGRGSNFSAEMFAE